MPGLDVADPTLWTALGAALLCGLAIGLQRQLRGHAAGLRTCALISMGCMLFARMGVALDAEGGDPTRVVGQIIVGVGFLGGGVIFNRKRIVRGMTSAAVIWSLAAIGSLAGIGAPVTALVVAGAVLAVLVLVGTLEGAIPQLRRGDHAKGLRPSEALAPIDSRADGDAQG